MTHTLDPRLLNKKVHVLLVGAGGSGCRVLESLVCLHRAMLAKGHPHGLKVTLVDPDIVTPANIGRQTFYACDVGAPKATTLINRAHMALGDTGASWTAAVAYIDTSSALSEVDIAIGAVDNRKARLGILRGLENARSGERYWLDLGNEANTGQVVLGQVSARSRVTDDKDRLPHVGELFPELIDPAFDAKDDVPSCSLAEALEKQQLFINQAVSVQAMNILWNLFTKGQIDYHGAFVNLEHGMVSPLRVDPQEWARFGVIRDGRRHKCVRPSRKAKSDT